MKILYICDTLITFIINEIVELKKRGHEVIILSRDSKGIHDAITNPMLEKNNLSNNYLRFKGFKSRKTKYATFARKISSGIINNPFATFKAMLCILKSIDGPKYGVVDYLDIEELIGSDIDVIHSPFSTPRIIDKAYLLSKALGIPFTLTFRAHDLYEGDNIVELQKRADYINQSSAVMTISDYNRKRLESKLGIMSDIKIVHSSIYTDLFKPKDLVKSSNTIITVCRLHEQKGLKDLMEACHILHERGIQYKCTVVGEGPEKENLKEMVNSKSIPGINFIDFMKYDDVAKELNSSSVFVLPCVISKDGKRDILANSLKEAMSMELPVVTTNICGIEELVSNGTTGLLIAPHRPEALADAVEYIFNNKRAALDMGKAGRKKILQDFNTEKEALKLENIFMNTISFGPSNQFVAEQVK